MTEPRGAPRTTIGTHTAMNSYTSVLTPPCITCWLEDTVGPLEQNFRTVYCQSGTSSLVEGYRVFQQVGSFGGFMGRALNVHSRSSSKFSSRTKNRKKADDSRTSQDLAKLGPALSGFLPPLPRCPNMLALYFHEFLTEDNQASYYKSQV